MRASCLSLERSYGTKIGEKVGKHKEKQRIIHKDSKPEFNRKNIL